MGKIKVGWKFSNWLNPSSANSKKLSNTLNKKSVFDHFVGLALKGLVGGDGKNYFKNRGMGL